MRILLTTSKKWAAIIGFAIVLIAVVAGASLTGPRTQVPVASVAARAPMTAAAASLPPERVAIVRAPMFDPASEPKRSQAAEAPLPAAPSAALPHFDVVRVEPSGDIIVAGHGAPDTTVALVGDGHVLAEARTDAGGHFAMMPSALQAGDHALTLRQSTGDAAPVASAQSVVVAVPERGRGAVVVALAEPGAATRLLSAPPAATAPASPEGAATATSQPLVVRSVELENGSGFYAIGAAPPGAELHVYLNDSHLTDVVASADGQWSMKVRHGLTGGHYVVRVDGSGDGTTIVTRAEVPFDIPSAMAQGDHGASPRAQVALAPPQRVIAGAQPLLPVAHAGTGKMGSPDAVIGEVSTASVRSGDNLWDISRIRLGQGRRYTRIYAANAVQIRDPRLIYPGQVFVLPTPGD